MKRFGFILALVAVAAMAAGCSSADREAGSPGGTTGGSPQVSAGMSAFSGLEKANRRAERWSEDAELYAIATAAPRVDAQGAAPGWLYTYVSESAGAVVSVSVTDGGVATNPEQSLPDPDIRNLSRHALPPPDGLLDSTEAMEKAEEVPAALRKAPEMQASAGLDSLSGGEPVWIFSTVRGGERVEERVPAG